MQASASWADDRLADDLVSIAAGIIQETDFSLAALALSHYAVRLWPTAVVLRAGLENDAVGRSAGGNNARTDVTSIHASEPIGTLPGGSSPEGLCIPPCHTEWPQNHCRASGREWRRAGKMQKQCRARFAHWRELRTSRPERSRPTGSKHQAVCVSRTERYHTRTALGVSSLACFVEPAVGTP